MRISPFLTCYISQGSVATQLRRGGKDDNHFIANSLLNPNIKNFKNRPTFVKVMNEQYRWSFLTHSVYSVYVIK